MRLNSKYCIILFLLFSNPFLIANNSQNKIIEERIFTIESKPSTKDWQYFMSMADEQKEKLWTHYQSQKKELKDWSWEWRIGWVKSCSTIKGKWCYDILTKALFDNAGVVRGEAANKLGEIYAGSNSNRILNILKNAYELKNNFRNGKPLFVQQRILFAIHKIGGKEASKIATDLSKNHKSNTEYWQKISKYNL